MKKLLLYCEDNISSPLFLSGDVQPTPLGSKNYYPANLTPSIINNTDVNSINVFDGTMAGPPFWQALTQRIEQYYDHYSGFVVATDINAMAEAAAALTYSIQGLGKPILFTGTVQRPSDAGIGMIDGIRVTSGVQSNLFSALEIADMDLSGTFILSNNVLINGSRALLSAPHINGFDLFQPDEPVVVEGRSAQDVVFLPKFSSGISIVTLTPGFSHALLCELALADDPEGVIVNSVGSYQKVPEEIKGLLEKACAQNCPVIITQAGGQSPFRDERAEVEAQNQFPALTVMKNISFPSLTTKFQWVIANRKGLQEIRTAMKQNFAGEIVAQASSVYRGIVRGRVADLTRK